MSRLSSEEMYYFSISNNRLEKEVQFTQLKLEFCLSLFLKVSFIHFLTSFESFKT